MTSLSSRRDYHVEHFPSGLMCNNLEHEFARTWKEDRTPSSPSEFVLAKSKILGKCSQASRTSSNSAMMQKASQHRFFVWVATTRLKLDPIRRYKCPMIGCEFQFESLEMMLQHLPLCTRLAQGVYYCVESGRNERVGKCSSPGCRDLKGRLTTVVNSSFNSVKRCLSGRSSKSQQHAEPMSLQNGEQLPHNEIVSRAEMGGDYFYPPEPTQLSELPTRYNKATGSFPRSSLEYNQEQTRNFIRGQYHELDSYGNLSRPLIYSAKQQEQSCAELDNSTSTSPPPSYAPTSERISSSLNALETWIYGSKKASSPQSGQSGSYVNEDDTWTYDPVFQHASSTSEFSNACDERHVDSIHSKTASSINGVPHLADNLQTYLGQNQNQISQVPSPYPEDKIVMEGLSVSMSQSPNQCWQYSPRTYSGTDSQLSERRSVFSSAASMSTRDSSMSSNDSRNAVVDSGQHTSTSFFGEETEMMSEEPDFMDESESMMPSPLRLPENNRQHIHTVNALESDANGVSIDDYAQPGSYLLGYDTQQV